jgi:hypothetical protein
MAAKNMRNFLENRGINKMTLEELKAMKLHEWKMLEKGGEVRRVLGGYIYSEEFKVNIIYIPEPKESEAKEGVCKWENRGKKDNEETEFISGCSKKHVRNFYLFEFKFCPYCGKKIDVVK